MKKYSYNQGVQITKHFNSNEFRCKCNSKHDIYIDEKLPTLLENLMTKIGAVRGDIYSGYRCSAHDKAVGGNGASNRSHGGYAVDIYFTDKNGKRINSKTVALALEDMGHNCGIGYRCGGSKPETGQTHIDVKPRKWYGDESKSMVSTIGNSFYIYFGMSKGGSTKYNLTRLLKNGCKGNDVKELQKTLISLGYSVGSYGADGSFGNGTKNAVIKFQKNKGISADGIVGSGTAHKLDWLYNGK